MLYENPNIVNVCYHSKYFENGKRYDVALNGGWNFDWHHDLTMPSSKLIVYKRTKFATSKHEAVI